MTAAVGEVVANVAASEIGKRQAAKRAPTPPAAPTPPSPRYAPERRPARTGSSARGRGAGPRTSSSVRNGTAILLAEWLLGAVLISITVPLENSQKGYQQSMTTLTLRLTGLSGIFFFLSLASSMQSMSKFAVWFGFIIDLGIIYHASAKGSLQTLSQIFSMGHTSAKPGAEPVSLNPDWNASAPPDSLGGLVSQNQGAPA